MNINRFIQSVLIMLVVVGVFAAMAKNDYGFELIGIGCFGLSLLFLVQFLWKVADEFSSIGQKVIPHLLELITLSTLTALLGLRAFYIYFDFSELLFLAAITFLMIFYSYSGYLQMNQAKNESIQLGRNLVFFYLSLLFFFIALLLSSNNTFSMYSGAAAVLISFPVLLSILKRDEFEAGNMTFTFIQFVSNSGNKAGLIFVFFISSSLFIGLTYLNVLPSIENVNQPRDYIELVKEAESGDEQKVDGKYNHERYKEAMNKVLDRHPNSAK